MTPPDDTGPPPTTGAFVTTRWTHVMSARGDAPGARQALSDLCAAYYEPVFRFLRCEGRTEEAARERAHEFFARLLARPGLEQLDPARGRFRSFLLGALKHFLRDAREREYAAKRGGGGVPASLDAADSDTSSALPVPATAPFQDTFFDRQWALTLMARALAALEEEFKANGKADHFAALKPWLVGETSAPAQAGAATQLGLSEGAVKVAAHRLRRRFREFIKAEIAQTVDHAAQVDEELRYLVEVLAQG